MEPARKTVSGENIMDKFLEKSKASESTSLSVKMDGIKKSKRKRSKSKSKTKRKSKSKSKKIYKFSSKYIPKVLSIKDKKIKSYAK